MFSNPLTSHTEVENENVQVIVNLLLLEGDHIPVGEQTSKVNTNLEDISNSFTITLTLEQDLRWLRDHSPDQVDGDIWQRVCTR